jgi:mRNA interferase MazF
MTKSEPKRGEIWLVNFDPTVGNEIQKARPAVVISVDALGSSGLRIVVPLTGYQEKHDKFPWCVPLKKNKRNGLTKDSTADAFQVKSVSTQRFIEKKGAVSAATLTELSSALALCVDM